jgi:hypothetical protein
MSADQLPQFSSKVFWSDVDKAMKRVHEIVDRLENMAHGHGYAADSKQAAAWSDEENDILERELSWIARTAEELRAQIGGVYEDIKGMRVRPSGRTSLPFSTRQGIGLLDIRLKPSGVS